MATPQLYVTGQGPGTEYYNTNYGGGTPTGTMDYGGNMNPLMQILSLFSNMGGMGFGRQMRQMGQENPMMALFRQMFGGRGGGYKNLGQQGFTLPNMGMGLGTGGGIPGAPPMVSGQTEGAVPPTATPSAQQSPWLNPMVAARDASHTWNPYTNPVSFGGSKTLGGGIAGGAQAMPYTKAFQNYATQGKQYTPYPSFVGWGR